MSDFDRIADRLTAEYASSLPKDVADHAFRLAWEHGHASGEGDVEYYFIDFVDLAGSAYHTGLRDGAS